MARLELSLLGPFQVFLDGKAVTAFDSNKVRALLAYLAEEAERPQRREALADLLWPGWPQASAMRNLSSALANLRKIIGDTEAQPPFLLIRRESLQLNRESDLQVDLWDFAHQLGIGLQSPEPGTGGLENLKAAISLYRGPLLEGFSLPDCALFEEWLAAAREAYHRKLQMALGKLAEYHQGRAEYDQALLYTRRQVELEPWLEEAHQALMRLLALSGQRGAALAQYEKCRKALKDELGVEPGFETTRLYEAIRDGKLTSAGMRELPLAPNLPLPPGFSPTAEHLGPRAKYYLPQPVTRFFGREGEIAQVRERLEVERLVTLTGSGGVGKTRLALRLAEAVLDEFRDGVWFVGLAPLTDPEQVAQQIAANLGLKKNPERPILEILTNYLRERQLLLILDNCEHLLEACARLAEDLLTASPYLKILASSREPLGVGGEAIFRVPSLPFPEVGESLSPEYLDEFASIRLFVDRARLILPGYQVTLQNAPFLASICQRLDGIPLAIELAATRMSTLTAEQLAWGLKDAFRLLTGGSRTALPRHQTLRATIDWSYQLLVDKERVLFRRLAIFRGGWDLEAAEAVCAGEGIEAGEILDSLAGLVNKSLVIAERPQGSPARYRMLETIRQFAREKLLEAGEGTGLRQRHLAYYLDLAERGKVPSLGFKQEQWLDQLERDLNNFRLALEVGLEEDPQAGLRLVEALWDSSVWEALPREGKRWLEAYLQMPENAATTSLRGHALWRLSILNTGNPIGVELAQESLDIFCSNNDYLGQGIAQLSLGRGILSAYENPLSAKPHLEAAQTIFEEIQDRSWLAEVEFSFGILAHYQGDILVAGACYERSLALCREIGDWCLITRVLSELAFLVAMRRGELRRGLALIEETLALYAQSRRFPFESESWLTLAYILCWQGDFQRASQAWEEARGLVPDDEESEYMFNLSIGQFSCWQGRLTYGINLLERTLKFFRDSSSLGQISIQQRFILENAYTQGCLGEIQRAEAWIDEFWPIFQASIYQPNLKKTLGFLALCKGESRDAVEHYRGSLQAANDLGFLLDALLALEGYAWALCREGQAAAAARALGAANEFRARVGAKVFPRDQPMYDDIVKELKLALGEEGYAAAWAEGEAMGFDQGIADALGDTRDSH